MPGRWPVVNSTEIARLCFARKPSIRTPIWARSSRGLSSMCRSTSPMRSTLPASRAPLPDRSRSCTCRSSLRFSSSIASMRRVGEPALEVEHVAIRGGAGQGLDAPHTGGRAGLVRETEERDLTRGRDVRAAAQLERYARHVHHANHVAVLLGEKGHRARRDRILVLHLSRGDEEVLPDVLVDFLLDPPEDVAGDRPVMAEVETQPLQIGRA